MIRALLPEFLSLKLAQRPDLSHLACSSRRQDGAAVLQTVGARFARDRRRFEESGRWSRRSQTCSRSCWTAAESTRFMGFPSIGLIGACRIPSIGNTVACIALLLW